MTSALSALVDVASTTSVPIRCNAMKSAKPTGNVLSQPAAAAQRAFAPNKSYAKGTRLQETTVIVTVSASLGSATFKVLAPFSPTDVRGMTTTTRRIANLCSTSLLLSVSSF